MTICSRRIFYFVLLLAFYRSSAAFANNLKKSLLKDSIYLKIVNLDHQISWLNTLFKKNKTISSKKTQNSYPKKKPNHSINKDLLSLEKLIIDIDTNKKVILSIIKKLIIKDINLSAQQKIKMKRIIKNILYQTDFIYKNPRLYYLLTSLFIKYGNKDIRKQFKVIIKRWLVNKERSNYQDYFYLALATSKLNYIAESNNILDKILKKNISMSKEEESQIFFLKSELHYKKKEIEKSVFYLSKVHSSSSLFKYSIYNLIFLNMKKLDFKKAYDFSKEYLSSFPKDKYYYTILHQQPFLADFSLSTSERKNIANQNKKIWEKLFYMIDETIKKGFKPSSIDRFIINRNDLSGLSLYEDLKKLNSVDKSISLANGALDKFETQLSDYILEKKLLTNIEILDEYNYIEFMKRISLDLYSIGNNLFNKKLKLIEKSDKSYHKTLTSLSDENNNVLIKKIKDNKFTVYITALLAIKNRIDQQEKIILNLKNNFLAKLYKLRLKKNKKIIDNNKKNILRTKIKIEKALNEIFLKKHRIYLKIKELEIASKLNFNFLSVLEKRLLILKNKNLFLDEIIRNDNFLLIQDNFKKILGDWRELIQNIRSEIKRIKWGNIASLKKYINTIYKMKNSFIDINSKWNISNLDFSRSYLINLNLQILKIYNENEFWVHNNSISPLSNLQKTLKEHSIDNLKKVNKSHLQMRLINLGALQGWKEQYLD